MTGTSRERIFWSCAEAAAYIGFSHDALYRWARNATKPKRKKRGAYDVPTPPFVRFGKHFRFPVEEFKAWAKTPTNYQQQKAGN